MAHFKQTLQIIKMDVNRRQLLESRDNQPASLLRVLCMRGTISVALYRLSQYCVGHRLTIVARLLYQADALIFKNEISPYARCGPGLVFANNGCIGITEVVRAGDNCTFLGMNSLTLGAIKGFEANQVITLGNHCVIGVRARIMRPIQIADGVQIKHNALVMLSADKVGSVLSGIPAKRRAMATMDEVIHWNPLRGGYLAASPVTMPKTLK